MTRSLALPAVLSIALGATLGLGACGDDEPGSAGDLEEGLRGLPGVTFLEFPTLTESHKFYVLRFTQPVDHADPDGPTFEQRVSLLHRDLEAPMVALTSGYWDYYGDNLYELTTLLAANQISIEHRYFGESRPDPADWSKLTIRQMADDQHRIIAALRTVYPGAFLTTGGSKGGMTATYHRRFYPDDVDGTVPYVAPISFAAPDPRYAPFLDTVGPATCRERVRAVATAMIRDRLGALRTRAEAQATSGGHAYTRIPLSPALESAIVNLEWAFWQYFGVNFCTEVPLPDGDLEQHWEFLDRVSPVTDNDDESIARFEAYYHQAYSQLGYPDGGAAYLDPYTMFTDKAYERALPAGVPAYDGGAAMQDIDTFVKTQSSRMLFVYGEWDPWTAGAYSLGEAADSLLVVQPQGAHGSKLGRLAEADRARAFDKLEAWTGVRPTMPQQRPASALSAPAPAPREPRVPPAMVRALRARR